MNKFLTAIAIVGFLAASSFELSSQMSEPSGLTPVNDPSQKEDDQIERRKLLKAADQIEIFQHENTAMRKDLDQLQEKITRLENALAELSKRLNEQDARAAKDRDALIQEVSKLLEKKSKSEPQQQTTAVKTPPAGEYFEHIVAPGESLWSIVQAYRANGNPVTLEEVKQANQLKSNVIHSSQKIYIPKKQ